MEHYSFHSKVFHHPNILAEEAAEEKVRKVISAAQQKVNVIKVRVVLL